MLPIWLFISIVCLVRVSETIEPRRDITIAVTENGPVRGIVMMSFSKRLFVAFRGIPYAEPPVGDLRFQPPQPAKPWGDILDLREKPPVCPQLLLGTDTFVGDEDCLVLNVFTHRYAQDLPVIFIIHGGLLHAGDSSLAPNVLLDQDIVLVTLNYRLGVLGFLSTGTSHLPGNYGLKDQTMALWWVKRNIKFFGGNPERVILYGAGSGGALVHYHMLSVSSIGLFHGTFYESATALHPWMFQRNPRMVANTVAKAVGCSVSCPKQMVACLTKKPVIDLVNTLKKFPSWGAHHPVPFAPTKETQPFNCTQDPPFLTENPDYLLNSGNIVHVPAITGSFLNFYFEFTSMLISKSSSLKELDKDFVKILRTILQVNCFPEEAALQVKKFYYGDTPIQQATLRNTVNLLSDSVFMHSTYRAARIQALASTMPLYFFILSTRSLLVSDSGDANAEYDITAGNVSQLMQQRAIPVICTTPSDEREIITMRRLGKILSDFAMTGNPTPVKSKEIGIPWKPVGKTAQGIFRYLIIGEDVYMENMPHDLLKRMELWERIYDEVLSKAYNGCPVP